MAHQDTYDYDFMVFIGRFQPVHTAHAKTISRALTLARHVVVLVGSVEDRRNLRNPFSFKERAGMIYGTVCSQDRDRVHVTPLFDVPGDDDAWVENVYAAAQGIICQYQAGVPRIGLIGHRKDETSYYLDLFPDWVFVEAPLELEISATQIREAYFNNPAMGEPVTPYLPPATLLFLQAFANKTEYRRLNRDYQFSKATTHEEMMALR